MKTNQSLSSLNKKSRIARSVLAGFCHAIACVSLYLTAFPPLTVAAGLSGATIFVGVSVVASSCWLLRKDLSIHGILTTGSAVTLISYPVCILLIAIVFDLATTFGFSTFDYGYDRPQPSFLAMLLSMLSVFVLPLLVYSIIVTLPLNLIVAGIVSAVLHSDSHEATSEDKKSSSRRDRLRGIVIVTLAMLTVGSSVVVVITIRELNQRYEQQLIQPMKPPPE